MDRNKTLWPMALSLALLALTVVALAGCGSSSTAKGSGGAVTEAQLGAPVYPGATKVDVSQTMGGQGFRPGFQNGTAPRFEGSAPQFQGSRPDWNAQGSAPRERVGTAVALWTPDSSTKVAAWYRGKLKSKSGFQERTFPAMSAGGMTPPAIFSFKTGSNTRTVMVSAAAQDKGGSYITVRKVNQGVPSGAPSNQGT